MKTKSLISIFLLTSIVVGLAFADGDLPTRFLNSNTVGNTRHNMTQRQATSSRPVGELMERWRNYYGEVCVYCHTPHGANQKANLPLWNRTMQSTTYTTYNELGTTTLTQDVVQPGLNSLACLSCHDGQTAIDSIINMPGSGRYLASQETSTSTTFLDAWQNPGGNTTYLHGTLTECLACHSGNAGIVGSGAADFTVALIGTKLTDDHPIGVKFPIDDSKAPDFNTPTGVKGNMRFFDANNNGRLDKQDVRLYFNNDAIRVECASCHDPHGVPSGGAGSQFTPTFLRVANSGAALCLTCHAK